MTCRRARCGPLGLMTVALGAGLVLGAPAGAAAGDAAGPPHALPGLGRTVLVAAAESVTSESAQDGWDADEGDDDGLWSAPPVTAPTTPPPAGPPSSGPPSAGAAASPGISGSGASAAARPQSSGGGLSSGRLLVIQSFVIINCLVIAGAAFSYGRRAARSLGRRRGAGAPGSLPRVSR